MKSKTLHSITLCTAIFGAAGALLSGCGGGSGSGVNTTPVQTGSFTAPGTTPFVNSTIASRAACTANTHVAGRPIWTILVYINAANNLQPFSLINVAQMASVGSNANLNIVIQWKQTAQSSFFSGAAIGTTPSFVGTRRYFLKKHPQSDLLRIAPTGIDSNSALVGDTTVLDSDRLPDPATNTITEGANKTADMGDYRTLADFVQWGAANFPADHIGVVVWDHGSGALNVLNRSAKKSFRSVSGVKTPARGLSQDVQTGNQIATQELPLALANPPQPIDALIIDCSLQGTTELAYDVRKSARVLVASEESPPGTGYPYDVWLTFLSQNTAGPCDSGQNLINDFVAEYPSFTDITQSMVDLSKMDAVASSLNAFGGSLLNNISSQQTLIKNARQSAQFFEFNEYKDLYDFADLIRTSSGAPSDLTAAAGNVETSLWGTTGVILVSQHGKAVDPSGLNENLASGLSIFLPGPLTPSSVDNTTGFDPAWNQLGIAAAAPNWAKFLQAQPQ